MTNMEHYRKEIEKITNEGLAFAVNKRGIVCKCSEIDCIECIIFSTFCTIDRMKWLMAEYETPKPKLTKRERALCEFLETGWITRDSDSELWWHERMPKKACTVWRTKNPELYEDINHLCLEFGLIPDLFHFIKWEDSKPWAVEDLLKLEVEE